MLIIAIVALLGWPDAGQVPGVQERANVAYEGYRACLIEAIRNIPEATTAATAAPGVIASCEGEARKINDVVALPDPVGSSETDRAGLQNLRAQLRSSLVTSPEAMATLINENRLSLTSELYSRPPRVPPASPEPLAGSFLIGEVFDPLKPTRYAISVQRTVRTGRYAVSETVRAYEDGSFGVSGSEYDCEARLSRLSWVRGYDPQQRQTREELNTTYPPGPDRGPAFDYACFGSKEAFRLVLDRPIGALLAPR